MSYAKLQWPPDWPRARQKKSGGTFNHQGRPVTLERAEWLLRHELEKLGARRVLVTIGGGAAAIYFTLKNKPMVMASDRYYTDAENLRSIGIAVEGMRTIERHGGGAMMDRAMAGFVSLPPPVSPSTFAVEGSRRAARGEQGRS
jgi:hypothetical protein